MSKWTTPFLGLFLLVGFVAAACGGTGDPETIVEREPSVTTQPEAEADEATIPQASADTTEAAEPTATSELEPEKSADTPVTFASLSDTQKRVVGGICEAAVAVAGGATSFSFAPDWALSVLAGESGVPALEEAFQEIGDVRDPGLYFDSAAPICEEIGWTPDS